MNLKKTVVIAAAAGALAAISVPAMAFENEFHGIYNLKFFVSNYENGSAVAIDPTEHYNKDKANNVFEQRARLQYIAKANDNLKLVTQFELDSKFGGDKTGKYGISSDAGVLDADGISLETKHVYLDFNLGSSVNVKTGIHPIKDTMKGTLIDADVAGITVTTKLQPLTLIGGYYRLATESSNAIVQPAAVSYNKNASPLGHDNRDLFLLISKFAVNKDINVGAAYYLHSAYTNASPATLHVFSLDADAKVGPATISGFVAAQTGYAHFAAATGSYTANTSASISGYAANLAAKAAVGPGTLKTSFLFTSGDGKPGKDNITAWQNTGFATYAEGGMFLLVRTGVNGINTDRNIIHTAGAGDKGLWLVTAGYDATITPKLYANTNIGMAWVAKSAGAPKNNGGDILGTELNFETGYKVYDNLTAKIQLAYLMLGGYYHNGTTVVGQSGQTPADPYTTRVGLSYAF
jgi:hypothetical protein